MKGARGGRWAALLFAGYCASLGALHGLFSREVGEPYMDEPFHLGQTLSYCAGRWGEWDSKLTTFAGLHASAAFLSRLLPAGEGLCELTRLRALNLLPALATPPLILTVLRRYHPEASSEDLLANTALLSLLPTHFFFHFLYYTDSAATVSILLLLMLMDGPPMRLGGKNAGAHSLSRRVASVVASIAALAYRQTNAVWIMFSVGMAAVQTLEGKAIIPRRSSLWQALDSILFRGSFTRSLLLIASLYAEHLLLVVIFAIFVVFNGGVAIGDTSNHVMSFHAAQLVYVVAYASVPFDLVAFSLRLPATLLEIGHGIARAPLQAAVALAIASVAVLFTNAHPFLLADNRHLTFYLWRHILSHPARRWGLTPVYTMLGLRLRSRLAQSQGSLRALGLVLATALVLVPTPLLELRYMNIPVLIARILSPPLSGPREWALPMLVTFALNIMAMAIFLGRPFVWADGTIARFMW